MASAIRIDGLWKEYRLGETARRPGTLYETLGNLFHRGERPAAGRPDRFWALRDVSLELAPGEVLGVIGRNGAGKSTLLKVLSRITEPTRGRIEIRGRLASLLEVGTGFHPELTGRENIFLNGAILGMKRREIERKFDEIVAFAEIETFLDTPVKRYSSGMYVRLAFAVAAHLEPDVLLVDEVLAVGDAAFQKRCLAKMGEVRGEGRTVIFVSHNLTAIQALSTRAIRLEAGAIAEGGKPHTVVSHYLAADLSDQLTRSWPDQEKAPGSDRVRMRSMQVRPLSSSGTGLCRIDSPIELRFEYWNLVDGESTYLSLHLYDEEGQQAFNTISAGEFGEVTRPKTRGLYRSTCTIPAQLLNDRSYRVELFLVRGLREILFHDERALSLTITDAPNAPMAWYGKWPGAVRPQIAWVTEQVDDPQAIELREP